MKRLRDCRLYGILDTGYCEPEAMPAMAGKMLAGGVDILQLRAKGLPQDEVKALALKIQPILREAGVPFIINDHPEVAGAIASDGVHVGQDDIPLAEARQRAGRTLLLGKSTHSVHQAILGEEECADYIGFGPLFSTLTKPDYMPIGLEDIAMVHRLVKIPIFCIGGVKRENIGEVLEAGARRIVVVSGILKAADVERYCRDLQSELAKLAVG